MIARGRVTHEEVFKALHEVATAAVAGVEPGRIAQLAATHCQSLLDADGTAVRWLDEALAELRLLAAAARQPTDHPLVMPLQGSLVGRAVLKGASVVCDDYPAERGALAWAMNTGIASIMVVPLLVGARAVGALSVFSYTPRQFTDEERQLVELLAAAIGPALESARVAAVRDREALRLGALHTFAVAAARELNLPQLAELAGQQARAALVCDSATVVLWDEGEQVLRTITSEVRYGLGAVVPKDSVAIWPCFVSGQPLVTRDYADRFGDRNAAASLEVPALVAAVPLSMDGRTIGCLVVANKDSQIFGDEEVQFLTLLAAQLAPALAASRLRAEVQSTQALFKEAFEHSALGMHLTSVETGKIVQANRALHSLLGYEEGALIGLPIAKLARLGKDEAETAERRRSLVDGEVERLHHRKEVETRDGRVITVEVNVGLVADGLGKPLFTVAQLADVTRQESMESFLREEAERMVELVRAQTETYVNDLDSGAVMQMLAEKARVLTGADGASVILLDDLAVVGGASSGEPGPWAPGDELGPSFARTCALERRTILAPDAMSDPRVNHRRAVAARTRSLVASPLIHAGRLSGVLQVRSRQANAFGAREAKTLELLAGLAAAAIGRAEMITAVRQSEEQLSALLAGAPVIVSSISPEGIIELAMGKGLGDLGLEPADVVGQSIHEDGTRTDVRDAVELAMAGITSVTVGRNSSLGRDYETHYSPLRDEAGVAQAVIAVAFDVTDRLAAERDLAESRIRLSAVVANAPVITFAINTDGVILLAEGAGMARLGLTPGVPLGVNVFELFAGVPEALAHIRRGLGGETFEGFVHIDVFDADFDARYSPLYDGEGKIIGMSGLATDITDRVRAENAERENEDKSRLMAMMNHEVRTPLNSVLGFAELLSSGRGGDLNEKQARYVLNIEVAGRHLLSLVNDSLDLAKLDADKMPIQVVDLELGPILDQAVGQVQPLAEARGIVLTAEAAPGLYVSGDRRRLLQVLWNLLSNSIKHSPTGSSVHLNGRRAGGLLEISVADHGSGIPPDQLERIFEEFHQVGPSQLDGTGLGLTVCRRLVAAMGGSIRVESELGAGSTFTVTMRLGG